MSMHEPGQAGEHKGESSFLVSVALQTKFRKLFETYYMTLVRRVQRDHERLLEQENRNRDAYIRSGEVFDDRQAFFEKRTKEHEKFVDTTRSMAELLAVPMPQLAENNQAPTSRLGVNLDAKSTIAEMGARVEQELASGKSPWEDEETRAFYTDLCDLRNCVPASLLGEDRRCETRRDGETDKTEKEGSEGAPGPGSGSVPTPYDIEDASGALATLLARLPDLTNRSMMDEAAVELALKNSRGMRTRLVRQLLAVPRERWDLLPYYARLVATLTPHMPDVGLGVINGVSGSELKS